MTGSHNTEQHTFEFQGSVQTELLSMTPCEPQACDSPQNYELDLLRRPMLNYNRDRRSCVLNCYQLSLWALSTCIV